MIDPPCKCGHKQSDHHDWGSNYNTTRCEVCIKPYFSIHEYNNFHRNAINASWHNFKLDNLKYLEMKYENITS